MASSRRAVGTPRSSDASDALTLTTSGCASSARRSRSPSASNATRTPAARASATRSRYAESSIPTGTDPEIVSHVASPKSAAVASASSGHADDGTSEPCS